MGRNYILATAGHVDHGKTALVKALTGTDPDRLPEERARGITIDLGFASLRIRGDGDHDELNIGVVDVPGHEDFVKNMVAGVGAIDVALLVVAADDGWMPQTEEHAQILTYLGAVRAVVAVTKIDRVTADECAAVQAEVRAKLAGLPFASAEIIGVSAPSAIGMAELTNALRTALQNVPPRRDFGKPRLWIDRLFSLRGVGTVVTGTLTGGTLPTGALLTALPTQETATVRAIHRHGRVQSQAEPGSRTALNVVGDATASLERGQLLTIPGLENVSDTCDVWLERSGRTAPSDFATRALPHASSVRLHVGTAAVACRIVLPKGSSLRPGETTPAQLRLDGRLSLACGERFVIRDSSERTTLAGGVVLEPAASRARFHRPAQQAFLEHQRRALHDPAELARAQLMRDPFVARAGFGRPWPFSQEDIDTALCALAATGAVVDLGACVARAEAWRQLQAAARSRIMAHHSAHPAQNGLPVSLLRSALSQTFPGAAVVFDSVLRHVLSNGFVLSGSSIRSESFRPHLPTSLAAAAAEVRRKLKLGALNPPCRSELAPDLPRQQALEFLAKTGEAILLNHDTVLDAAQLTDATTRVRQYLNEHGAATVSELRQALGTSRRIMVPLLERLDREGVTLRRGEQRILRVARPESATAGPDVVGSGGPPIARAAGP